MFIDNFCERCSKLKEDADGMPMQDNCSINEQIHNARFDDALWPKDSIVRIYEDNAEFSKYSHVCKEYHTDDDDIMRQYLALFGESDGQMEL